jgi:hypothetical protein
MINRLLNNRYRLDADLGRGRMSRPWHLDIDFDGGA